MSKPTREKLEALRKAKRERLPDWLRDVSDYVEHRIFNQEEDGKDGEMWREHGCDMLTKIGQLMNENERLRKELKDLERDARAECRESFFEAQRRECGR